MYYNFAVANSPDLATNPELLFDKILRNPFIHAMEDCFYCNPIHEKYESRGGVALDNIMPISYYLIAVKATYNKCLEEYRKAALSNMFKNYSVRYSRCGTNVIRLETINNTEVIAYRNIEYDVALAIIWGAYFYASLCAIGDDTQKPIRDFLFKFLVDKSCLTEAYFKKNHLLMRLYGQYFVPTCQKISEALMEESKPKTENNKTEEPAETQEPAKSPTPSKAEDLEEEGPALDLHNRLKVAYILQLLNITSKEQIKNERALCRVLEAITGASRKTVRDYLKTFTLVVAQNRDEINQLNKDLNTLGFPLLKTQLKCE